MKKTKMTPRERKLHGLARTVSKFLQDQTAPDEIHLRARLIPVCYLLDMAAGSARMEDLEMMRMTPGTQVPKIVQ